jgi:hypothetical protein
MHMSKQICRCTLIAGMVLVLAAVVILLHGGITRDSGPSQRVRVELALTHLEACESCHMAGDTAFVVVEAEPVHHTIVVETAAPARAAHDDPVRAQLVALGHRLLDLPAAGDAYFDAAADAFLAAYQAHQTGSAVDMPGLLAVAVQQVIEAEHHAHPVQVRASTTRVSPGATDAVSGIPPASWAMSNSRVIVIQSGLDSVPVREKTAVSRPVGVVLGVQRRGPPAAVLSLC